MPYLSTKQVREILNISRPTVRKLIAAGELQAIKGTGRNAHVKIEEKSLQDYIARHAVQAVSK